MSRRRVFEQASLRLRQNASNASEIDSRATLSIALALAHEWAIVSQIGKLESNTSAVFYLAFLNLRL